MLRQLRDGASSWARVGTIGLAWVLVAAAGCSTVPKGRYGVASLEWKGVTRMSEQALESCLATKQRERVALQLGLGGDSCGEPPFDEQAPRIALWSWPWTTWPVYDAAIFEVDKRRIERWYQARGFYDARIVSVHFERDGEQISDPAECRHAPGDCRLRAVVRVDEGLPVTVHSAEVTGELSDEQRERLFDATELEVGDRFDEALVAAAEARLLRLLRDDGHARARVRAESLIDRDARTAKVMFRVTAGPRCHFGELHVSGARDLDVAIIEDVAAIRPGEPYTQSALIDAERAIHALGTFAAVRVEPVEAAASDPVVDLAIRVIPGRRETVRLGIGVMSGELTAGASEEVVAVPEWDVHLRASYRNDDFLGGMRRFRLEERPRLIMLEPFPRVPGSGPRLGNSVEMELEQPRFVERRTVLFTRAKWDFGPDPYRAFFRHAVASKLGVRRAFFAQTLRASFALAHDVYEVVDPRPAGISSYRLPFLEQQLAFDLRDDTRRARRGLYAAVTSQQALRIGFGSWRYLRLLPEARAYQALPLRIVLAQRLAFGALFMGSANPGLDATSRLLGPQEYRLRGGGATSNRGFAPGRLGAGIDGGLRRWEGSLEARLPLGSDFGFVLFFDVGDVNRGRRVRFDHLNAATGFGLRYFGLFVPLRVDLGWRIPGAQVIDGPDPDVDLTVLPSAAHITIGEAF